MFSLLSSTILVYKDLCSAGILQPCCSPIRLRNSASERGDTLHLLKHKIFLKSRTPHLSERAVLRNWAADPCRSSARGVWDLGCRRHGSGGWQIHRAPGPASLGRPGSLEGLDTQTQRQRRKQGERRGTSENIIMH